MANIIDYSLPSTVTSQRVFSIKDLTTYKVNSNNVSVGAPSGINAVVANNTLPTFLTFPGTNGYGFPKAVYGAASYSQGLYYNNTSTSGLVLLSHISSSNSWADYLVYDPKTMKMFLVKVNFSAAQMTLAFLRNESGVDYLYIWSAGKIKKITVNLVDKGTTYSSNVPDITYTFSTDFTVTKTATAITNNNDVNSYSYQKTFVDEVNNDLYFVYYYGTGYYAIRYNLTNFCDVVGNTSITALTTGNPPVPNVSQTQIRDGAIIAFGGNLYFFDGAGFLLTKTSKTLFSTNLLPNYSATNWAQPTQFIFNYNGNFYEIYTPIIYGLKPLNIIIHKLNLDGSTIPSSKTVLSIDSSDLYVGGTASGKFDLNMNTLSYQSSVIFSFSVNQGTSNDIIAYADVTQYLPL
jgi:hypothetical protein